MLLDKKSKSFKEDVVFFEEILFFEFREGDVFLEQIFFKIEVVKLEVRNLKNRVDKVMIENLSRFFLDDIVVMFGLVVDVVIVLEQ